MTVVQVGDLIRITIEGVYKGGYIQTKDNRNINVWDKVLEEAEVLESLLFYDGDQVWSMGAGVRERKDGKWYFKETGKPTYNSDREYDEYVKEGAMIVLIRFGVSSAPNDLAQHRPVAAQF